MRSLLRTCGELCVTGGLAMLLFCAYLLWGTGSYTEAQQSLLKRQLRQAGTAAKLDRIRLGQAIALIKIPRLGRDYEYAVLEGVTSEDLRRGPGHYPGTAGPGKIGNFVLSGHRTTYAAPFNRIDELRTGDAIVIDAREARYTYRVSGTEVVAPEDVEVIAPVPNRPGARPKEAVITLTTCHPEYSARQRLIVHGVLSGRRERRT
ncbi:class E sortase [Sphaerisporangium melleum]|uniref:Class E sortase n=1 Tax=Sphaerisporangium melleum TaxID=321316 RepID=A0A917R742_9ACTN|nr:class E sortase [Sphaerisporangium melleum]GGK92579.1 class E sortase [Sphaerisporangium melleum]GII73032.1 class E sortase [Sphaerisporangium melleum]